MESRDTLARWLCSVGVRPRLFWVNWKLWLIWVFGNLSCCEWTRAFQHIYHIGCAFNLHSIINNGLLPGGQDSSIRQTVFFLPIDPRDKDHEDPEHIDFSVPRRAQYLHSAWKKHQDAVFWVDIDLAIKKKDWHSSKHDRMQLFSKEHFQRIVFQKLWDWRLEKFCMRNRTCLLDHHQRSHYDTITIGPEGMINWVLQLNNSQSVNSFDSLVEKFNMQSSPNQPNQNPNQSVIDRGNLRIQNMFLLNVPFPRDRWKRFAQRTWFFR